MTRQFTDSKSPQQPRIDPSRLAEFFSERAHKVGSVGYDRAVIYQDQHPELAAHRDQAEKGLLMPKMALTGTERVLDIGCGTGRWTSVLADACGHYHGIDFSAGLVEAARERHADLENVRFSVLGADAVSLDALHEDTRFDRVGCFGLIIYLNDELVPKLFSGVSDVLKPGGIFVLREPVGVDRRLTLDNHYSDEMQQYYSAIYRTFDELVAVATDPTCSALTLVDHGDMYSDPGLNNRVETKQHWFLFRR